jgi:hypothetical protein
MALAIDVATGFSTNFQARRCTITRVGAPVFLGTSLLEITHTGGPTAENVRVTPQGALPQEIILYGPTSHFSVAPGAKSPVGVLFLRRNTNTAPASAVITLSWTDAGSHTRSQQTISVIATPAALVNVFLPSQFELIASGAAPRPRVPISLQVQQTVNKFEANALPATSAFSESMPLGSFLAGATPEPVMTLAFDNSVAKQRTPQVVTVSATGPGVQQSIPIICWVADTVLPGEVAIVGISADPPGPDLPNESVTIGNRTTRSLDLTGCVLRDEAGVGQRFVFPDFALGAGASVNVHSGPGQKTSTDLFWQLRLPVWNNDLDSAVLYNFAGDEIARFVYAFAFPGVRIPGQTKILDSMIFVIQAFASTPTGVVLEDGDFIVFDPNPMVLSWAGNVLRGATGPAGDPFAVAPFDGLWPMAGAPMFALLAEAGGTPVLVGGTQSTQQVNRTSTLRAGNPLNLMINDSEPGGWGAWGGYLVRLRVFRK